MTYLKTSTDPISLDIFRLEDVLPADLAGRLDLTPTFMPDALLAWWQGVLEKVAATPRFATPSINPDLAKHLDAPAGGDRISLIFCARDGLEALTGAPKSVLGIHLLSPVDHDAFGEGDMTPKTHRLLVVSDRSEFLALTADLAKDNTDPENFQDEYVEAWLTTAFHEIAHALTFAENAGLLSPLAVEDLSDIGETSHDIFDCSTGYGIRPLDIKGYSLWAEDMEDAQDLMEAYVEDLGREIMHDALQGEHTVASFLEAANLTEDCRKALKQTLPLKSQA